MVGVMEEHKIRAHYRIVFFFFMKLIPKNQKRTFVVEVCECSQRATATEYEEVLMGLHYTISEIYS